MASSPQELMQALNRAVAACNNGRFAEAELICQQIVSQKPDFFDALHFMAIVQSRLGQPDKALASYERALAVKPDDAPALSNRGALLQDLKRFDEALASFDRALKLRPEQAEVHYNRGNALKDLNRFEEALASYDRAITLRPDYARALYNRGNTLRSLRRPDEALASYDRAVALQPTYVEALANRAVSLHEMKRHPEALASCDRALAVQPAHAQALLTRGLVLQDLKRHEEALASYDRALAARPRYAEALCNRGNALTELRRLDEAVAAYDQALAERPDYGEALCNRGNALFELQRYEEALASFDRALTMKADHANALWGVANCTLSCSDWRKWDAISAQLREHITSNKSIIPPFLMLNFSGDAALHLQCARHFVDNQIPQRPRPLWTGDKWRHDRLRVAYLSADFRNHPVSHLAVEMFERHDRSRFETIGVSFGVDDRSEMRGRVQKAFDRFHDVRAISDHDAAKLLHELQVDIAVDLVGYIKDARYGILAHRPAPIQVNYLGFPASMAADFIDYVLVDPVTVPFDQQPHYTEKLVHLPDSFLVNSRRTVAARAPTRAEAGLPENGFVFCCFNQNWRFNPAMFDVWMRLLQAVEGSVLWLLYINEYEVRNLYREAQARGVDPGRLVFAPWARMDEHLTRYRAADLFLDTLPYNGQTTASDALFMGTPVLTCLGTSLSGRVAASLLHAVGLPELVTQNFADYEALALRLAREPALLAEIKGKLARNRDTHPLFDTARFTRHVEAAYTRMWEAWQRGEQPAAFAVEPIKRAG